jgi:DNA-binding NtrC family response regulator
MATSDDPTVLAVDDDEKLLETYRMWLDADYDLRLAAGGEEALEKLDDDVQVVLLDRLMPGLSGDEVLERIRESGVDCRVAMVTAVEPDFDVAEMPFDAYVPKALDRETVVRTVERLVARDEYDDVLVK